MIPSFVIHHESCKERIPLVNDLIEKTNGTVSPAIWLEDRKAGCRMSHQMVAHHVQQMARHKMIPDTYYLIFEDDCILEENWKDALDFDYDIVYIGYNDKCEHTVFGTHALLISPKARDLIVSESEWYVDKVMNRGAWDWILSKLAKEAGLTVKLPERKDQYCHQKTGLISTITGEERKAQ